MPDVKSSPMVIRTGKLFECGTYPDKDFSLTEAELDIAVSAFAPVPANIEHRPSLLDTHLGGITRVWKQGAELFGEIETPDWLHTLVGDEPIKPSLEWDRGSKRILGVAYTLSPRITDAALMSAFSIALGDNRVITAAHNFAMSRHNTPEGQMAMQDIHDAAARSGAVCDRTNALMSSQHEMTAVQKIHDIAASHGANCTSGDKPAYYSTDPAVTAKIAPAVTAKGETMFDKLKSLFSQAGVPDSELDAHLSEAVAELHAAPGMTAAEKAAFTAMETKAAAFEAETNRLRAEGIARDASTFADAALAARRAVPAERANIIAAFTQAATDDASAPAAVSFSIGAEAKTGSRVDVLKALIEDRPAHTLTADSAAQFTGAFLLPSAAPSQSEATQADVDAQVSRMLASTIVGQQVLAAKK